MSRLPDIRAAFQKGLTDNADLFFPEHLVFRLGEHAWEVHCSVKDPQRLKPEAVARLQAFADMRSLAYTDLRVLKVQPGEVLPFPGAVCPFDDGTLEVLEWSQASPLSGQRTGTAVLRRP
ncbi:hypothetical protein [Deinococcus geothermalis]|uniref:hypothetical protein n=1 Tax=Deinococcus geothermalis TaxID=68909 RepID=UPI002356B3C3|nr:hypothetical protein [Deinococcus geothermalis]